MTFLGNAILESGQRTGSRRDAAIDREAANLRNLQDAISEFALVWGPIMTGVLNGGPKFNPSNPADAGGPPGSTYSRMMSLAHRAQVDGIRTAAHDWAGRQLQFTRTGQRPLIATIGIDRMTLDIVIADRIRTLEAAPPPLWNRLVSWSRRMGFL